MRCTLQSWRPGLITTPGESTGLGLNIDVGANTTFPKPGPGFGGAAGQAGRWNAVSATTGSANLIDIVGNDSAVTVSVTGGNGDREWDNPNTNFGIGRLLDDLQDAGTSTWTFNNLRRADYDVFVYSWAPDAPATATSRITVSGSANGPQICGGQEWTGQWIEGGQYVVERVTDVTSITIEVAPTTSGSMTSLNGIQVVPVGVDLPPTLGSTYCSPANVNSTGDSAQLRAFGFAAINANDIRFDVTHLPEEQLGLLLMARNQSLGTPIGSGRLCLAAPVVRFSADVLTWGDSGQVSFAPDLASLPHATAIQPGESWNFQFWYRDTCVGPTSNLTDANSILFR